MQKERLDNEIIIKIEEKMREIQDLIYTLKESSVWVLVSSTELSVSQRIVTKKPTTIVRPPLI